jgi:hypothetical protein
MVSRGDTRTTAARVWAGRASRSCAAGRAWPSRLARWT